MTARPALALNVSIALPAIPFLERFAVARDLGFHDVESWWPFDTCSPEEADVGAFLDAIRVAGVHLRAMNLWAGDLPGGERGFANHPGRRDEVIASAEICGKIARATGAAAFNCLYGQDVDGLSAADQDVSAIKTIAAVADILDAAGGTILVESLARGENGAYPLETFDDSLRIATAAAAASQAGNVAPLFDTYHLGMNGEDIVAVATKFADRIAHCQVADAPGRHEPGTGGLPIGDALEALYANGYAGIVAGEFRPKNPPQVDVSWIEQLGWN